ncbi:MAG: UDP-galactopyranose mutase [Elusimicrobiaceae bacterium]|nr:UDP-galactopyranose mutase [bacterium]MBR2081937.1 UDP-galactopyranose mutase [Elusimicrobiaceae bacterium]
MINLVVGAGFSGASIARKVAEELNEKVVVIDSKNHIAGNAYDYRDKNGIMIHKYGSHIFHTNMANVWNFISRFTSFNTYMHKVVAFVDGVETTIPFNLRTLYDIFPETLARRMEEKLLQCFEYNKKVPILEFQKQDDTDLKFLADYVYEKIFLHYTIKQWGVMPNEVDGEVTARVPVYISCDKRYFQDKYQGIPLNGYTKTIENMLNHPNIEVLLNTAFANYKGYYDRLFYTGPIDEFFNYKFGELGYRSVNFKLEEFDRPYYQCNAVVNYPCNYDFTRIHEYKYYLNDISDKTVIAKEYSSNFEHGKNERYYPIPNDINRALYQQYLNEAKKLNNAYFLGRLGDYRYYDMDQAVFRALNLFNKIKGAK